jgi:hypothetical protein
MPKTATISHKMKPKNHLEELDITMATNKKDSERINPLEISESNLKEIRRLIISPRDYPKKDGSYPRRHICQVCGQILGAADFLDYGCNKHGGH